MDIQTISLLHTVLTLERFQHLVILRELLVMTNVTPITITPIQALITITILHILIVLTPGPFREVILLGFVDMFITTQVHTTTLENLSIVITPVR